MNAIRRWVILAVLVGAILGLAVLPGGEEPVPVSAGALPEESLPCVVEQLQRSTAVIPHERVICSDPALPRGTSRVLREGVDGELLRTSSVLYRNGEEIARYLLEERVKAQPVAEVVAVGCAPVKGLAQVQVTDTAIRLPTGEVLHYERRIRSLATAYCDKGLTATGTQARVGAIAVDPRVIPYGTRMFIMTADGEYIYGLATAEDCGSREHIYGTRIDLHLDTYYECRQFGARECLVFILE